MAFRKVMEYLESGSPRSVKARKNILLMLFIKGATVLINLLMVPLTLSYVGKGTYGIWLTLSSMVAWISFFDIGINNGLKNKLTEAIALGDYELGRKYVSTTYALMTLIFIPLMVILLLAAPAIDWQNLLKISGTESDGLLASVSIVITYFCINFILSTINVVMLADQRPSYASIQSFLQQFLSLLLIFVLVKTTKGSLTHLCIGLCVAPLAVITVSNAVLFSGRYHNLAPSFKHIDFRQVPSLMKLGVQFFIIQIAGLIQYQMVNFLIIRHFGASDVTSYNIAYKYFSVLTMVWGIMIYPIWAAVTDALANKDFSWIENSRKKYSRLYYLFLLCGTVMLIASNFIYKIWVGEDISISFALSFWVFVYTLTTMFGSIYVNILNGLGQLQVQTIACMISPFVFLGVTFLSISLGCGVYSILIGSVAANFNGFLLAPVQYKRYIKSKI